MRRIIKFRAWDGSRMIMPDDGSYYQHYMSFCGGIVQRSSEGMDCFGGGDRWRVVSNLQLMQFTGLTDRNGVEIYEGDIVSISYVTPFGELTDDVDFLTDVNHENGCFCIFSSYLKAEREPIYNALLKSSGRYVPNHGNIKIIEGFIGEVIGNIHQNPELLK